MKVRLYTELAMAVALAVVLDLISKNLPIPRMPHGGSISLHMLPIFIVAFRQGWKGGCMAGGMYGAINFMMNPHIIHPIQVPLDYPIAFGLVGLAGLGPLQMSAERRGGVLGTRIRLLAGVIVGNGFRFLAHFSSGVIFWGQNAPAGQPVWLYSLIYNLSYMVPETIISILLLQLVLSRLFFRPEGQWSSTKVQ